MMVNDYSHFDTLPYKVFFEADGHEGDVLGIGVSVTFVQVNALNIREAEKSTQPKEPCS